MSTIRYIGDVQRMAAKRTAIGFGGTLAVLVVIGCGNPSAPNPFERAEPDAGPDAAPYADSGPPIDADADAAPADPTLGGPCLDDGQCDDGIDCTFDGCDVSLERCRYTADDLACEDGVFCNGLEVCVPGVGCRDGPVVSCSDETACTIDSCTETDHGCVHEPRDADSDGDPDINCEGGGDCDERAPRVSSLAAEVCANSTDDDCDGEVDEESDCASPEFDDCVAPLEISASGSYELSPVAARTDVSAACITASSRTRDLVVALIVPEGPPVQIDAVLTAKSGTLGLATADVCGQESPDAPCVTGVRLPDLTSLARLVLRDVQPGAHPLYVFTDSDSPLTLKIEFEPVEAKAPNETCGTATLIYPGVHVSGSLTDVASDVPTACEATTGDLVYEFSLSEPQDVRIFVASLDGYGVPSVSLRTEACASEEDEIVCRSSSNDEVYWRALPAGRYFVSVSASGPTDFDLLLTTSAPSAPPVDESCTGAPALTPNEAQPVTFDNHVDDIRLGCSVGLPDAAYALQLTDRSDVLLIEQITDGDSGVLALSDAECSEASTVCAKGDDSPVRLSAHDLAPGSYRAVVETQGGGPATLSALVRPAQAPIYVAFADTCDAAVDIPSSGALLTGNTANASGDYDAACDIGGSDGAPDQMLRLTLSSPKRVVLDMQGSAYSPILDVRRGPDCPGREVAFGCSAGYTRTRSYLDVRLEAGEYFVQIDGYAGAKGQWFLDVYVVDP